jgi:hypothetical protein
MAGVLTWDHAVHDIPDSGLSTTRHAAPDELERVAQALDLLACSSLVATCTITPAGGGHYRLVGRLQASLQQACVVTLEPVASQIDEAFDVYFWPEADIPPPASGEVDLDEGLEPEPIVAGQIEVGRVVFECLAGGVNLFPRKADAALDRASAGPDGGSDSPFAVLTRIKEKD